MSRNFPTQVKEKLKAGLDSKLVRVRNMTANTFKYIFSKNHSSEEFKDLGKNLFDLINDADAN